MVPVRITSADRSATVFVTLEQSVAALDPMRVVDDEGDPVMPDARLEGFYKRAQTNSFGRYITEAMIEKAHAQHVSDLMRTLPGVLIRPTRKIGNTVRFRNCGVQRESPETVGPLVWVDGVRMPGAELDEVTQAADVAAIEVYPALAGIPAQFFDRSAVCGTILSGRRIGECRPFRRTVEWFTHEAWTRHTGDTVMLSRPSGALVAVALAALAVRGFAQQSTPPSPVGGAICRHRYRRRSRGDSRWPTPTCR